MKILVVEDELVARKKMQILLQSLGYETLAAKDGVEGWEFWEKERSRIIITDWLMPGMDGVDLIAKIREAEQGRYNYIIMVTAKNRSDDIVTGMNAGADDFITKPIVKEELAVRIKAGEKRVELEKALEERNQLLQNEIRYAEKVFANVVQPNDIEYKNLKCHLSPMQAVGGDLILTAPKPSGGYHILVGDFTGHGLSAAIGAIPVSDIFYQMTDADHSIVKIIAEINRKLKSVLPTGLFLCGSLIELDEINRKASLFNCGLPDGLVTEGQGIKARLPSKNLPLGIVSNGQFNASMEVIEMAMGDRIYIYTDGIIEASNPQEEMFGQQRLEDILGGFHDPDKIFDEVISRLESFHAGKEQSDDITLVEIT